MNRSTTPTAAPVTREEAIEHYRGHTRQSLPHVVRNAADEHLEWDTLDGHPVLHLGFNKEFAFRFFLNVAGCIETEVVFYWQWTPLTVE